VRSRQTPPQTGGIGRRKLNQELVLTNGMVRVAIRLATTFRYDMSPAAMRRTGNMQAI